MLKAKIDARRALKKLKKTAKDARNLPYAQIGAMLNQSIDMNFASGGRYSQEGSVMGGSQTWQPLKDSSRRPLDKTGTLRRSINYKVTGNAVELFVDDGVANLYAATHQYGDNSRGIPARPFLVVQPEDDKKIEDILSRHFGTK